MTVFDDPDWVFSATCPTRPVLDQIADKWSLMIMSVLAEPRRFNEIKRRLQGVTQRVLTQTLRRLERNGMIERRILPTSPIGVQYSLTPLGESLREPFAHLYEWTLTHADEILEKQRAYDKATQDIPQRQETPGQHEAPGQQEAPGLGS